MAQFTVEYFDNVVRFSGIPDKHMEHVGQVLTLLNGVDVTPNLSKCKIFINFIDFLCHAIR